MVIVGTLEFPNGYICVRQIYDTHDLEEPFNSNECVYELRIHSIGSEEALETSGSYIYDSPMQCLEILGISQIPRNMYVHVVYK